MAVFKSYPPNEYGDDFVVGDIHGHRQRLLDELARQGFNKAKDRLFSVGDLIDRGPDSFDTLALLSEPWFHFVRGNHEDDLPLFLQYQYPKSHNDRDWHSDTAWVYHLHIEQIHYLREKMLPALSAAPIVLRVEGAHGFWVVHADRGVFGRRDGPLKLLDDERLPLVDDKDLDQIEAMLWSRRLMREIPHVDLHDQPLEIAATQAEVEHLGELRAEHGVVTDLDRRVRVDERLVLLQFLVELFQRLVDPVAAGVVGEELEQPRQLTRAVGLPDVSAQRPVRVSPGPIRVAVVLGRASEGVARNQPSVWWCNRCPTPARQPDAEVPFFHRLRLAASPAGAPLAADSP